MFLVIEIDGLFKPLGCLLFKKKKHQMLLFPNVL